MKRNVNRLLSLALALVMLVGILPLVANAEPTIVNNTDVDNTSAFINPKVIYQRDFDDEAVDTAIKDSTLGTLSDGYVKWVFSGGTNDSFTVNSFDPDNYGNSAKIVCDDEGATRTRQAYFEIQRSKSNAFSTEKVYRVEMDVYGLVSTVNGGFFYLTAEGASGSIGSDGNATTLKNNTKDGAWTHITYDLQPTQDHYRMRAYVCINIRLDRTIYVDNIKITEYTPVSDVTEINSYSSVENNSVILGTDADLTGSDLVVAAGSTLELNGNKLTANSVTVANGGKIIDSSNGEGRLDATSLVCASDNPYLPLATENEGYLFVKPNMTDSYVKTSHDKNGFEIALRPGFGKYDGDKSVRKDFLSKSNAGITLTVTVAWKDVYGQTGEKTVKAFSDEDFTQVYSSTSGKYFYTKFSNPGDSQYYDVTFSLVANGVTVSRTLHFDNLAEADKTYLFAHNFDGTLAWADTKRLYSMNNADKYISHIVGVTYAVPSFNGTEMALPSDTKSHQIDFDIAQFLPEDGGKLVLEMDVRMESSSRTQSRVDFIVRNTVATGKTQYRQQVLCDIGSKTHNVNVGNHSLPDTPGTSRDHDAKVTDKTVAGSIIDSANEYTTLKMVLDYDNMTITVTVGNGEPVTKTILDFNDPTFNIIRWYDYDSMFIDWMKVYHIAG